nr:hypothetical protein [Tanacetum cinerariifolium]
MTSRHIILGLDLTYAPSIMTSQKPIKHELDLLFEAMYDEYIGCQPPAALRTAPTAPTTQDVKELPPQPEHGQQQDNQPQLQSEVVVENVQNAMFDENTFVNPFAPASISSVESSSQYSNHMLEILKKYGIETYDPIGTPMETKNKLDLDKNGTLIDAMKYQSMIGDLMYLTSNRPDILHATCLCDRYQARSTEKHLKEVKEYKEKDKIGTKPDQIKKKGEAWQRPKESKAVSVSRARKTKQDPISTTPTTSYKLSPPSPAQKNIPMAINSKDGRPEM